MSQKLIDTKKQASGASTLVSKKKVKFQEQNGKQDSSKSEDKTKKPQRDAKTKSEEESKVSRTDRKPEGWILFPSRDKRQAPEEQKDNEINGLIMVPVKQNQAAQLAQEAKAKRNQNQAEYRKRLMDKFEICRKDYNKKATSRGISRMYWKDGKNVEHFDKNPEELKTCSIGELSFTHRTHPLIKYGSKLGSLKTRYFLVDNANLIYFTNQSDTIAKGIKPLLAATSLLQTKEQHDSAKNDQAIWHDKAKEFRVIVTLAIHQSDPEEIRRKQAENKMNATQDIAAPTKQDKVELKKKKPFFIYSDDKDFCFALQLKIRTVSDPEYYENLNNKVKQVSQIARIVVFKDFWTLCRSVYSEKVRHVTAFQSFGKNLLRVADQNWQRNSVMIHQLVDRADDNSVVGLDRGQLISTFRMGNFQSDSKPKIDSIQTANISLILVNKLKQLVYMIKSRRQFRPENIAKKINDIYSQQIRGTKALSVKLMEGNQEAFNADSTARLSFQPHSPSTMFIENLDPRNLQSAEVMKNHFIKRIDLDSISMIATDNPHFFKPNESSGVDARLQNDQTYKVKIFGRNTKIADSDSDDDEDGNNVPEFEGLSPLRMGIDQQQRIKVVVEKLEFPAKFIRQHQGKGFMRITLTQSQNEQVDEEEEQDEGFIFDEMKQFSTMSEDFRLSVKTQMDLEKSQDDQMVSIHLPQEIAFTISPLLYAHREQFKFKVFFYYNVSPIPTVIKDYMSAEVYTCHTSNARQVDQSIVQELQVEGQENHLKIYSRFSLENKGQIDEREGKRLLIGRYCIFDGRMPMQVIKYSKRYETVSLKSIRGSGEVKEGISLDRIQRIERYGVSIYDLQKLPKQLQESKFEFECTIQTKDSQFLTTLLRKISDHHVKRTYLKRQQLEQKVKIAKGKLMCSIIQAENLDRSLQVAFNSRQVVLPQVQITLERMVEGQESQILPGRNIIESDVVGRKSKYKNQPLKMLKNVVWAQGDTPTGSIHDLGTFSRNFNPLGADLDNGDHDAIFSQRKAQQQRKHSIAYNLRDAKKPLNSNNLKKRFDSDSDEDINQLNQEISNAVDDAEEIYIRFQVLNGNVKAGQNKEIIGQSLIQASKLIDLQEPYQSKKLILLLPGDIVESLLKSRGSDQKLSHDKMFAGTLDIQTVFVPDLETRWNFDQYESRSEIQDPEAMKHLNQLLNASLFDSHHYRVPTMAYNPENYLNDNYFKRFNALSRPRILVSKGLLRQQMQDIHQKLSENPDFLEQKQQLISQTIEKRYFANQEEIRDFLMYTEAQSPDADQRRPMMQEFSDQFIQRWLALTTQDTYDAQKRKIKFIWYDFLNMVIRKSKTQGHQSRHAIGPKTESEDNMRENINSENAQRKRATNAMIKSQFKAHNPSLVQQNRNDEGYTDSLRKTLVARDTTSLNRNKHTSEKKLQLDDLVVSEIELIQFLDDQELRNVDSKIYADLHYQVHKGIPDELRITIWKTFLRSVQQEPHEIEAFKQYYSDYNYDSDLSLYENYVVMSQDKDCLAFKQIDEDVFKYQSIDSYLSDCQDKNERDLILRSEKNSIRNILRVLILWSKQRHADDSDCIISYGTSMIDMIQRLNSITKNEEECFSILTGMIRAFKTPFAVEKSIMLEKCENMMRYEMTALKAMIEQGLPSVYDKLKAFGLPIELLTSRSITSFYAADFPTEVVHRLWDIIIFWLSSPHKDQQKFGLWWLLSPAFLILQEKAEAICKAISCDQIIEIYKSGFAMNHDPQWYIDSITEINRKVFVEGQIVEKGAIGKIISSKTQRENIFAQNFEAKREEYQSKLIEFFKQVKKENQVVDDLIVAANQSLQNNGHVGLNSSDFRETLLASFDKIQEIKSPDIVRRGSMQRQQSRLTKRMFSIAEQRDSEGQLDNLQTIESQIDQRMFIDKEALLEDMKASQIHVCVHSYEFPQMPSDDNDDSLDRGQPLSGQSHSQLIQQFDESRQIQNNKLENHFFRVSYGRIDPDTRSFKERKNVESKEIENHNDLVQQRVDLKAQFHYAKGNNFIQIELFDGHMQKSVYKQILAMPELPFSRVIQRKLLVLPLKGSSKDYSQMHINLSFFMEDQTDKNQEQNTENERILACFLRKSPDFIDFFRPKQEELDFKTMSSQFTSLIQREFTLLVELVGERKTLDMMNETYNHFTAGDYGQISFDEFKVMVSWLFPKALQQEAMYQKIYDTFSFKPQVQQESDYDSQAKAKKIKKQYKQSAAIDVKNKSQTPIESRYDFSLSKLIVTCVLMSQSTVEEKLSLLFDSFVKVSGVCATITPAALVELISIIFNRNMYFWPSHELYNQIEHVFTDGIGMVHGAFWTKNLEQFQWWIQDVKENAITKTQAQATVTPDEFKFLHDEEEMDEDQTMDVTKEVQQAIMRYFSIYGTKTIDFNPDVSPFAKLHDFVGQVKADSMLRMAQKQGQYFKLILCCETDGERFRKTLTYSNETGLLLDQYLEQSSLEKRSGFSEVFERNDNKLFLSGMDRPITKDEFLSKAEDIPFFTNLIRVETFQRDRNQGNLKPKTRMMFQPVHITFFAQDKLFIFRFKNSTPVEGTMIQRGDSYQFEMKALNQEDTLADARRRISIVLLEGIEKINQNLSQHSKEEQEMALIRDVIGQRDFNILTKSEQNGTDGIEWKLLPNDLLRFSQLGRNQSVAGTIMMKLENPQESEFMRLLFEQKSSASYDCLSVYRHADQSLDWLPCKIVTRTFHHPKKESQMNQQSVDSEEKPIISAQHYTYEVSFLHLAQKQDPYNVGHNNFQRSAEEILFSARFTRELQLTFKQECLEYIHKTYEIKCNSGEFVLQQDNKHLQMYFNNDISQINHRESQNKNQQSAGQQKGNSSQAGAQKDFVNNSEDEERKELTAIISSGSRVTRGELQQDQRLLIPQAQNPKRHLAGQNSSRYQTEQVGSTSNRRQVMLSQKDMEQDASAFGELDQDDSDDGVSLAAKQQIEVMNNQKPRHSNISDSKSDH